MSKDIEQRDETFQEWGFWKRLTRRKWYLYPFRPLDKKLQYNIALLLAVIGIVNAAYFSILFYFYSQESFFRLARYIPQYIPPQEILRDQTSLLIKTVVFVGTFEVILIVLLGLFFSHRIAGPLYVMGVKMNQIARKEIPHPVILRKNDLLTNFAAHVNDAIATIREQQSELQAALDAAESGNAEAVKSHLNRAMESESTLASETPQNETPPG